MTPRQARHFESREVRRMNFRDRTPPLAWARGQEDNQVVPSRARKLTAVLAFVVATSVAAAASADLRAAMTAMACCVKADYRCAIVGGPDDCCQHMGHTAQGATLAPPSHTTTNVVGPVLVATLARLDHSPSLNWHDTLASASALKRPHDPPHLHTFSLLISIPHQLAVAGVVCRKGGIVRERVLSVLGLTSSLTTLVC